MLPISWMPVSVALYSLMTTIVAETTGSVVRRDTYDHGTISVELLGGDKGIYSKLKVRDSLSTTLNGAPIPYTDQSTTCTVHLMNRGATACDSPDWHTLLTETGHDDDAGSGSVRIYHHVNYQSLPELIDAGDGYLKKNPNFKSGSVHYYRQTYNVLVFLGGKAGPQNHTLCEQPQEASTAKETFSFIQGPAPAVPQTCWALGVNNNAHYNEGT